jgi:hypothetical protein
MYKIDMNLNGTIEDLLTKVLKVSELSNDMYIEFDRIRVSVEIDELSNGSSETTNGSSD